MGTPNTILTGYFLVWNNFSILNFLHSSFYSVVSKNTIDRIWWKTVNKRSWKSKQIFYSYTNMVENLGSFMEYEYKLHVHAHINKCAHTLSVDQRQRHNNNMGLVYYKPSGLFYWGNDVSLSSSATSLF